MAKLKVEGIVYVKYVIIEKKEKRKNPILYKKLVTLAISTICNKKGATF
jgi:hypothetical protein